MKTLLRSLAAFLLVFSISTAQSIANRAPRYTQYTGATGVRGNPFDPGMLVVPTTTTTLTSADTWVQNMLCSSTSSTTLTITDAQGAGATCGTGPCPYFPAVAITPNNPILVNFNAIGMHFRGIKWSAGATGVACQLMGVQ